MDGTGRMLVWILFVGQLSVGIRNVDALSCLNCDAIAHPRICSQVTECFPGEKCGMETYIDEDGQMTYKLGCFDSNTCSLLDSTTPDYGTQFFSCHSCCDDRDLCNVKGCNSTGYPVDRGPICYSCGNMFEGTPCHHIEHCEKHEVCYNEVTLEFQKDRLVTSGCKSKHHCAGQNLDPLIGIGKRTAHICSDCCQADLCNVQCENADICSDEDTCSLLMASFDVCTSPDTALQFCKKTCGLCPNAGSTCQDTRFDCEYIYPYFDMCTSEPQAKSYGCLDYCGFCPGVSTNVPYTHTTPTFAPYTHTTPTFAPYTHTTPTFAPYTHTTPTLAPNTHTTPTLAPYTHTTPTFPPYTHTTPVFTPGSTTAGTTTARAFNVKFNVGEYVIRGPDWQGGNQDGDGPGTVINTNEANNSTILPGIVQVLWYFTNITESYRVGANGAYELSRYHGLFPPINTPATVSNVTTASSVTTAFVPVPLSIGNEVIPGPDWMGGSESGNGTGTVLSITGSNKILVYWNDTGLNNTYIYGKNGTYELQVVSNNTTTTTLVTNISANIFARLSTGDIVVRGPDWIGGNMDGYSTGTVIDVGRPGWVRVLWNATNVNDTYRYGENNTYEVQSVSITTVSMTTLSTDIPTTTPYEPYNFQVGDRVVRGPDWRYGTQDGNGEGTVTDTSVRGWVGVRWDFGSHTDQYRNGLTYHDVIKIPPPTVKTTPPTTSPPPTAGTVLANDIYVGAVVQRGRDWRYGTQDGNGNGTVMDVDHVNGWVKVQWRNGYLNNYRLGAENAYDVMFVPGSYKPPTGP